ncbi:MAG: hypothetical protein QXS23_06705 [Desulfurococcaceae archaeon]
MKNVLGLGMTTRISVGYVIVAITISLLALWGASNLPNTSLPYMLFLLIVIIIMYIISQQRVYDINKILISMVAWILIMISPQLISLSTYIGNDINVEDSIFLTVKKLGTWDSTYISHHYGTLLSTTIFPLIFTELTSFPSLIFFKFVPYTLLGISVFITYTIFMRKLNIPIIFTFTPLFIVYTLSELSSIPRQAYAMSIFFLCLYFAMKGRFGLSSFLLSLLSFYHYALSVMLIPGIIVAIFVWSIVAYQTNYTLARGEIKVYYLLVPFLILIIWYLYAVYPVVIREVAYVSIQTINDIIGILLTEKTPPASWLIVQLGETGWMAIAARWLNRLALAFLYISLLIGYIASLYKVITYNNKSSNTSSFDAWARYTVLTSPVFVAFVLALSSESFARALNLSRYISLAIFYLYPFVYKGAWLGLNQLVILRDEIRKYHVIKHVISLLIVLLAITQTGIIFELTSSHTYSFPLRINSAKLSDIEFVRYQAYLFIGTPIDRTLIVNIFGQDGYCVDYDAGSYMRYWNLLLDDDDSPLVFLNSANLNSNLWRHTLDVLFPIDEYLNLKMISKGFTRVSQVIDSKYFQLLFLD